MRKLMITNEVNNYKHKMGWSFRNGAHIPAEHQPENFMICQIEWNQDESGSTENWLDRTSSLPEPFRSFWGEWHSYVFINYANACLKFGLKTPIFFTFEEVPAIQSYLDYMMKIEEAWYQVAQDQISHQNNKIIVPGSGGDEVYNYTYWYAEFEINEQLTFTSQRQIQWIKNSKKNGFSTIGTSLFDWPAVDKNTLLLRIPYRFKETWFTYRSIGQGEYVREYHNIDETRYLTITL